MVDFNLNHNVVIFIMTFAVQTGSIIPLPVCVRLCLSSWLRLAKAFTQEEQLKTLGFWELGDGPGWCTRSCSCRQIQKCNLFTVKHLKSLYQNVARTEMLFILPMENLTHCLNHKFRANLDSGESGHTLTISPEESVSFLFCFLPFSFEVVNDVLCCWGDC